MTISSAGYTRSHDTISSPFINRIRWISFATLLALISGSLLLAGSILTNIWNTSDETSFVLGIQAIWLQLPLLGVSLMMGRKLLLATYIPRIWVRIPLPLKTRIMNGLIGTVILSVAVLGGTLTAKMAAYAISWSSTEAMMNLFTLAMPVPLALGAVSYLTLIGFHFFRPYQLT